MRSATPSSPPTGLGELVVLVPAALVSANESTVQRLRSIRFCARSIESKVEFSAYCQPDERGALPPTSRRDALELTGARVIEFNDDPLHLQSG